MGKAKKDALGDRSMEIAEEQRDAARYTGPLAGFLEGEARLDQIFPYPEQSAEDFEKAKAIFEKFKNLLWEKVNAEEIDKTGEIPEEVLQELKELGLFGIKIPPEYGGLGFSQRNYHRFLILMAGWDASVGGILGAHNSIGVSQPLLGKFGTEEQRQRFLPRIAKGAISGVCITEEEAGSDFSRMRTYALRVKDPKNGKLVGYRLNGEKLYTTNVARNDRETLGELFAVIARIVDDPKELDDPKVKPCFGTFVVEAGYPGFTVVQRCEFIGTHAIYNGVPCFEEVMIPVDNRIGNEGDGIRVILETLASGRAAIGAAGCGGLKQILALSRWRAANRIQWFNRRIGDHELIAKKLADIAGRLFALEAMTGIVGAWIEAKQDARLEAAALKVFSSKWAWEAADEGLQIYGGRGYETANSLRKRGQPPIPMEMILRDVRLTRIVEGANEILRLWQAREALDAYMQRGLKIMGDPSSHFGGSRLAALAGILKRFLGFGRSQIDYSQIPKRLRKHLRFVEKDAKALTRTAILASGLYQKKLQHKQIAATTFSDAAATLFAIAAVCSYATYLYPRHGEKVLELADYFCWEARKTLHPPRSYFAQILRDPNRNRTWKIGRAICDGDYRFLEEGVLPLLKKLGCE